MSASTDRDSHTVRQRRANVRLALILASIAATFFVGSIVARSLGGIEMGMSILGMIALLLMVFAIVRNIRGR